MTRECLTISPSNIFAFSFLSSQVVPVSMKIISLLTASQLENNWEDCGSNHIYVNPIDSVCVLQSKSCTCPHNLSHCTVSFVNVPVTAENWQICLWHGCKTSEEEKSSQSNLVGAEWPLNEFKLWSSISHPVVFPILFPLEGHAAVGVQLGFLLLVSMFSTEGAFLKGPSVQQMLHERGACWQWWDLIPSWGPGKALLGCDAAASWSSSHVVPLACSSLGCLRPLWAPHCVSKVTQRKD